MKINEIFYSIQGEGLYAGASAVFVRLAFCNLKCAFCDTDFQTFTEFSLDEITSKIRSLPKSRLIVITGGEPSLHSDLPDLLRHLLNVFPERQLQIESNGSLPISWFMDFVGKVHLCISPKSMEIPAISFADSIKLLHPTSFTEAFIEKFSSLKIPFFIQPIDQNGWEKHIPQCLEMIEKYPFLRLSLQLHKILKIQ